MKRKLMEAMEYMDQKYIDEAVQRKSTVARIRPLLRWGALAACVALVIALGVGFMGGSNEVVQPTENISMKEIVLPPTRVGASTGRVSLVRRYSIEEAVAEAEIVAWIKVGNWLGQRETPMSCTFYEAEVITCFKGEIPTQFVLKQLGSAEMTFKQYPLFTYGNELLLFLNPADLEIDNEEYENCYMIMGTYSTVMDVVKDSDDNIYVSDRHGMLGKSAKEMGLTNLANADGLRDELTARTVSVDAIQSEFVGSAAYVYTLDSLESILKG